MVTNIRKHLRPRRDSLHLNKHTVSKLSQVMHESRTSFSSLAKFLSVLYISYNASYVVVIICCRGLEGR